MYYNPQPWGFWLRLRLLLMGKVYKSLQAEWKPVYASQEKHKKCSENLYAVMEAAFTATCSSLELGICQKCKLSSSLGLKMLLAVIITL